MNEAISRATHVLNPIAVWNLVLKTSTPMFNVLATMIDRRLRGRAAGLGQRLKLDASKNLAVLARM